MASAEIPLGLRAVRLGRIPTVTLGRYKRYRREAIDAWLRDLDAQARR
jgi:hypothetical protein